MLRIKTEWSGTGFGMPYLSTMYFDGTTQGIADDAAAAVIAFWQAIGGNTAVGVNCSIDTTVDVVDPITGNITASLTVAGGGMNGADASDPLPYFTQGLLRWNTGVYVSGRQVIGHTYLPGQTEGGSTNGRPISGLKSLWLAAGNALRNDTGNSFGVWSRKNGTFNECSGVATGLDFAVLRSRRS